MAFDQATRNRLSKFVSDTRKLLSDEFSQQMRVKYGLDPATGVVTDFDKLPTMGEGDRQSAQMLRDTLEHYLASSTKRDKKLIATTINRIVREQAFTVLNRLCAVRMAEARDLVIESIAQGTKSKGFQLYARLAGSALGETGEAYVCYLFSLFDELSIDLPVLFDRFSPSGRLFPKESVLSEVLEQINHHELQHLWAEDETIGWVYQYFNSQEERRAMRDESSAPRNSRELAVRNQFFTPRYVVEFLTDNTLGRIWYEMTQGQTRLVSDCKYLVRRRDEVFLSHMTSKELEHPSDGMIAMAELLLSGTDETFPEFSARDHQPMIDLAHCVSAYTTMGDRAHEILANRTLVVRERSIQEPWEVFDAVEAAPYVFAGQLGTLKTQHILEVLFMTCRSDRHGGDGSVYSESWFVDACNEIRRRVLESRRDDLTQEELLRQPVFIPYRPVKDPRDIKMLDPACGSMHFGLYAFDLFLHIYEEAWELEERLGDRAFMRPRELKSLHESYGTREQYMLDAPRLIIERNIHGIDIDARAVQIAGLSLWLRAQKAWHEAGVKQVSRPPIIRSNIVCAEPMPGESVLLEQFITDHLSQTSEQQTIASIVRRVFDAMKLAGEAGSLLKIDEEIADTIAEAKKKWVEGPKAIQLPLFAIDAKQKDSGARPLLVAGIDDASFWDEVEERIYSALSEYGERAGGGFQRRLFAADAAQGFAFIDLCRKRYDVLVMNPPFGRATDSVFDILRGTFPTSYIDLYCCFVEQALRLCPTGTVGAITSRSFLNAVTLDDFRDRITPRITQLIDLGLGVLDNALVEVAATIFGSGVADCIELFDVQAFEQKEAAVLIRLQNFGEGHLYENSYLIDKGKLQNVPKHQILYKFAEFGQTSGATTFEPSVATVRAGLNTFDNFRFVRCWWEVEPTHVGREKPWEFFSKGGEFETFYDDVHLVLNRANDGEELAAVNEIQNGQTAQSRQSHSRYYIPGLIYTIRSSRGFNVRHFPAGCVFSIKGPVVQATADTSLGFLIALLNCEPIRGFIQQQANANQYMPSLVKSLPWVEPAPDLYQSISARGTSCIAAKRAFYVRCEENASFLHPSDTGEVIRSFEEFTAARCQSVAQANEVIHSASRDASDALSKLFSFPDVDWEAEGVRLTDHDLSLAPEVTSESTLVFRSLSYALGCIFGRWDIRNATGDRPAPESPDPFAPLPVCPPGMLQGDDGLPLSPEAGRRLRIEGRYPLDVAWDGILVEDPEHPLDLERRVHAALAVLWGDRADALEHEACALLGVPTLREWFRRPAGFFADHLKRYSKSRRQAPIYWPLSTASGSYTLWIYYHRLNAQTLYTAVNDFVEPKLKQVTADANRIRQKTGRSSADEKELEQLTDLEQDLNDFHDELLRIAAFWKPNLNDGVQITAAPLWKLFRLAKWQKTLKDTWFELEASKYDWAQLALTIWPDRVVHTAHKDRSIAIAHGLKDALWHEVEIRKSSKTGRLTVKMEWQPREISEKELDAIVQRVKNGESVVSSRENAKS